MRAFLRDPLLTIANQKRHLVGTYVLTILVGAFGFMLLESRSLVESLYWAVVAGTSTGFGDIAPKTEAGMMFTTAYLLWTIPVLLSLVTAFILDRLRHDPHAFTHEEQEEILQFVRAQNGTHNVNVSVHGADFEQSALEALRLNGGGR